MKLVKIFCAVAAAGLIASGAPAQMAHRTVTTRTVTKVHVERNTRPVANHGRRMAWGHHRTCRTVWRHHHQVRICSTMPSHHARHTVVRTRVVTH